MNFPYSERYEKSVLSTLFSEEVLEGEETLTEDHFYLPSHRDLYRLIMNSPRPIDLVRFTEELMKMDKLDKLGGAGFIAEIFTFSPTNLNFQSYLKDLHIFKARRHAIKASLELIESAQDVQDDESFISKAGLPMTLVSDISSSASNTREKKHIIKDLVVEMERRLEGKSSSMGWPTGIKPIDDSVRGLHPERLYIISGYPTSGKTVLAIQLCWRMAVIDIPALVISLELPDHKIAERNLIISSGLPAIAISEPLEYAKSFGMTRMKQETIRDMKRALNRMNELPIFFEDPTGASIEQIVAIIRRNVKRHGVKVVAVDYLQLVKTSTKAFSKEQEITDISHTFQALAKELKIQIILLSQQNKDGGTKYAESPAEDADAVLTIVQDRDPDSDDFTKHLGIGIRKDRHHGKTGDFLKVVLNKEMLVFEEVKDDDYFEGSKQRTVRFGE